MYHFLHFYPESIAGRLILGPLKDDSTILPPRQGSLVYSDEKTRTLVFLQALSHCLIFTIENLNRSPTLLSCLQIHFLIIYFVI